MWHPEGLIFLRTSHPAFRGWPKDEKQHRKMAGLLPADNPGPDYDVPFEAGQRSGCQYLFQIN